MTTFEFFILTKFFYIFYFIIEQLFSLEFAEFDEKVKTYRIQNKFFKLILLTKPNQFFSRRS